MPGLPGSRGPVGHLRLGSTVRGVNAPATSHAPNRRTPPGGRRRVVAGPTWHKVERPGPGGGEPTGAERTPLPGGGWGSPSGAAPSRWRRRLAVPGVLDSRLALVAAVTLGLLAGAGAGAAGSMLRDDASPAPAAASPQECAAAQVAWTESAARQATMELEKPETLRNGFVGASLALAHTAPPAPIAKDWNAVKSYLDAVAAPLEDIDPADSEAVTAAVGGALAQLDTQAATAASARVTAYLKSSCQG